MNNVLDIEVNGQKLVFYPDFSVKFMFKSTLFLLKPEAPSRSFTWKIPAQGNQVLLQFMNLEDARQRTFVFSCRLFLFGNFYTNGLLDITDFNDQEYSIRVRLDRGYYAEFGQRSLRSFSYNDPLEFRYDLGSRAYSEYKFNDHGLAALYDGETTTVTITYTGMYDFASGRPAKTAQFSHLLQNVVSTAPIEAYVQGICDWFNERINETGLYFVYQGLSAGLPKLRVYQLFGMYPPSQSGDMLQFSAGNPHPVTFDDVTWHSPDQAAPYINMFDGALGDREDYVFFPVYAPALLPESIDGAPARYYPNMFKPRVPGNPSYPGERISSPLVPFAFLKYVLYTLHQEGGITVERDEFFDEETGQLVLFNDWPVNDLYNYPGTGTNWSRGAAFRYKDILPDISVSQLINDLRYTFNTLVDYDSRQGRLRIVPIKNLMADQSYLDWTGKAVKGYSYTPSPILLAMNYTWPQSEELATELLPDLGKVFVSDPVDTIAGLPAGAPTREARWVKDQNRYYRYDTNTATWAVYAEELYGHSSGSNPKDVQNQSSTLFSQLNAWPAPNFSGIYDAQLLLPYTKQKSSEIPDIEQKSELRFLFFRGFQDCKVKLTSLSGWISAEYPMGSCHNYDQNGVQIGNYSLAWNAVDGLVNIWYKSWLQYLAATSPMRYKFTLSIQDLMQLDLLKKIRINNQLHFIDEIEFEINARTRDTVQALATVYPIRNG